MQVIPPLLIYGVGYWYGEYLPFSSYCVIHFRQKYPDSLYYFYSKKALL